MTVPLDFSEIPFDWLAPGVFLEVRPNYRTLGILPYPTRLIIIAHKLSTGTLPQGQVREITSPDEAVSLLGQGSIGVGQVKALFGANKTQPVYIVPLDDATTNTKASGTFTFAGTVSTAITLRFRVNDTPVRIVVASGASVTVMAAALRDAINADASLPVTAAATAGVVTVTCRHGGEVGNDIDLRVDENAQPLPEGLTCQVAAMSNGTGNPSIQPALDALAQEWLTHATMPFTDANNMTLFRTFLGERFKALAKLDMQGFVSVRGTYGELGTFGDTSNSPFLSAGGLFGSPTAPWEIAAACCGLAAFHLTNDPARQLGTLPVPGVTAPDTKDQFTDTQRELLLRKGISTFEHLRDGTTTISRMITTYTTSTASVADPAWMDVMVPATVSRIRYDWAGYMRLRYPRAKLIDDASYDDLIQQDPQRGSEDEDLGPSVTAPKVIKGSWAARCALYQQRVWIQNVPRTVRQSQFSISDSSKNTLVANQQIDIVGNLITLMGALEFQV